MGQIKTLVKLELANLFGFNVLRHTKDPKAKRKAYLMTGLYLFLILVVFGYVGGLCYGLILLGAGDAVPAYLIAISSILIFFFGTFTAGATLFRANGYDILCSLPVTRSAIVVSRFVRMYVENLALTLVILTPGIGVYAWLLRPGMGFWLTVPVGILAVPCLPVAAASLVGAVVTGISSRMKHKSLAEAGLSILVVLALFLLMPQTAQMEGEITPELLAALSDTVLEVLGKLYPPAVWLGTAIANGDLLGCLGWAGICVFGFLGVAAVIAHRFHAICRRLRGTTARHDYRMGQLKQDSVLICLVRREFRRYFASGIYVSNTIMGPVLGTVLSGGLYVTGMDRIREILPLPVEIGAVIPYLVAGIFCMMTTSSVSISMEGKTWWILKTLPIPTKTILDAKILMNLGLMLPFYLVSQVFLLLALKPVGLELVWLLAIPVVIGMFSCVYGITVNLHLPVLDWENEASVVKQSASALFGGLGGLLVALVCMALSLLAPSPVTNLRICAALLSVTAVLYTWNNRFDWNRI